MHIKDQTPLGPTSIWFEFVVDVFATYPQQIELTVS